MNRSWNRIIVALTLFLTWSCVTAQQTIVPVPKLTEMIKQSQPVTAQIEPSVRRAIPLVDSDYLIGPQDLLRIEVFQVEDFSRSVRVSSRGHISLPLIGVIAAIGLTTPELEKKIAVKLSEDYLQDPYVTVFIEEFTSQRVTIEGAVRRPGIYALMGRTSLLQIIALAEGFDRLAEVDRIQLFRKNATGEREILFFDIDAIRAGEQPDPDMMGNDIVVVHQSGTKSAFKNVADFLRGFIFFGGTL